QVLAGSEHGGADPPARGAHERRAQDLETLPDGHRIVQQVVRLLARAGRDVQGDRHGLGAVVRGEVRRQAAGPPQSHHPPAQPDSVQEGEAGGRETAQTGEVERVQGAGLPVQVRSRGVLRYCATALSRLANRRSRSRTLPSRDFLTMASHRVIPSPRSFSSASVSIFRAVYSMSTMPLPSMTKTLGPAESISDHTRSPTRCAFAKKIRP